MIQSVVAGNLSKSAKQHDAHASHVFLVGNGDRHLGASRVVAHEVAGNADQSAAFEAPSANCLLERSASDVAQLFK